MLQDVMKPPPERLSIEEISSPIAAQILDFCDNDDLFGEPLLNSGVSSGSAADTICDATTTSTTTTTVVIGGPCCYDDSSFDSEFSTFPDMDAATLSALLDSQQPLKLEPDNVFASTSYLSQQPPEMLPTWHPNQLDQFIMNDAMAAAYTSYSPEQAIQLPAGSSPLSLQQHQQQGPSSVYEVGYMDPPSSTPCSFLDVGDFSGFYNPRGLGATLCGAEDSGPVGFFGGMMVGMQTRMAPQDFAEFKSTDIAGAGMYRSESIHRVYSSGDLQVIGERQHLVGGCSVNPEPSVASDISTLDESSFKVGRLSVEERKEKINRYMKKRHERNFNKKIKYACRKTLADSRPRVRGRFAKNDELGEVAARPRSCNHEIDDEEEGVMKEGDMLDSSDILADISGMNSFKYNYSLKSWI